MVEPWQGRIHILPIKARGVIVDGGALAGQDARSSVSHHGRSRSSLPMEMTNFLDDSSPATVRLSHALPHSSSILSATAVTESAFISSRANI